MQKTVVAFAGWAFAAAGESFLGRLAQLDIKYWVKDFGKKVFVIVQTMTAQRREEVSQAAKAALGENLQTVAGAAFGACAAYGSLGVAAGFVFSPLWIAGVTGVTALALLSTASFGQFAYSIK